jgi:SOS response regulatory protein OraA/RecX
MFQNMIMQNPQMSSALSQIQNSTQGANPKDVAMQLARQRGMSEQEVMNMFNSLNRK